MSLLGIDVGTTGCKAAAFTEDGRCLADAYREYPTLHPQPGWAELDSRHVWACTKATIGQVAAACTDDPVTALCVSSMGEAMTPVTADREILGNAILCSDERGGEYIDALGERITAEAFYRINPNILGVAYSLPKLQWVRDHEPDLYRRADTFLLWGDLVTFLLGGDPVTSFSHANRTLLFDVHAEDWSETLLELGGIERSKLPAAAASGTVVGTVSDAVSAELGLPAGVRIVVGGHDQCCNSLGAGIYEAGRTVCGIGSFECLTPTFDHIPDDAAAMLRYGLGVEHHVLPGLYVSFVFNQGGLLFKWFRDTFAAADAKLLGEGQDIYDVLAAEMPPGPTRLLVLPYFDMTGPPAFIADASGVVVGLKTSTTRGEILKAVMESVTFYFVDGMERLKALGVDSSEFVATGGGAKSDPWLQIKADIFGVPFVRPQITECSVLGAAMLAGLGTGRFTSPAEAADRFVSRQRVFEPDAGRHAAYAERVEKFRELFPLLREFLKAL